MLTAHLHAYEVPFKTWHKNNPSRVVDSPNFLRDTRVKVTIVDRPLLTRKLCRCDHSVFKNRECIVFLFVKLNPDKELLNMTTVHRLVKKFRGTGSVCLWQVDIERQTAEKYDRTDFKRCISCNKGTRLQESRIFTGVVLLCVKRFNV
jgi:hypothetical protein